MDRDLIIAGRDLAYINDVVADVHGGLIQPQRAAEMLTEHFKISKAVDTLKALTLEQRREVMAHFCRGCGTDDLPCHCENDE